MPERKKSMSLDSKFNDTMANGSQTNVLLAFHSTYIYWGPKREPKFIPGTGDPEGKKTACALK